MAPTSLDLTCFNGGGSLLSTRPIPLCRETYGWVFYLGVCVVIFPASSSVYRSTPFRAAASSSWTEGVKGLEQRVYKGSFVPHDLPLFEPGQYGTPHMTGVTTATGGFAIMNP